ncbi:YfbR-like 5'-deoxynucleotidase [Rhizobium sp. G187]|uniref:YfbR-like 5'-deoxynucleotidase n=1 Tax=Rhizobium sp. G187 TaxID=3451352 RepID=UPI003EE80722
MASSTVSSNRAWQRMLSGRRLDLLDPSPLDVEITDIAHGLARVARWNGQTFGEHAFSVAQHSLIVEDVFRRSNPKASSNDLMLALLHDAPEYVIGDMISPFKAVVGGGYKVVEKRLEAAIHLRFGLPAHPTAALKGLIKKADMISAYFEATVLAGFSEVEARKFFGQPKGFERDTILIEPLPTFQAQAKFIERFEAIEAERQSSNRARA